MKEDIEFVFDETWEEQQKELLQVLHEIDDPELHKNVYVLETFVRACALTYVKSRYLAEKLLQNKIHAKYVQKILNVPVGVEVQPIPVPSTDVKVQPVQQFKDVTRYTQKIVVGTDVSKKEVENKKNLIIDRITSSVLASVAINDKYLLSEPELDDVDIKVLNKVKSKKIKNMEKGWQLIQKYGKKYGMKAGHDTSIKYYVVNDVFGLGKIEALLHDNEMNEIRCEEAKKSLIVKIGDKELETNVNFDYEDLVNFNKVMAYKLGKKITKKTPNIKGELRGVTFLLSMGENLNKPSFIIKRNEN